MQERTVDDLTVPFGEEIVAVALVVPNGRIAIVVPPQLPPRAEQLGRLIKDNADTYQRGLKAIAAHRYEDARVLLDAAAREGRADPLQVQLAQAQTDMYAGLFAKAAAAFEKVVSQKPDNVMYLLQGAAAWLQAGVAENAEPLVARAMKACSEKPAPNDPDKDRELAYSLHVQAVMQAVHGSSLSTPPPPVRGCAIY